MADDKKSLRCSFCGKAENQVHRMIQGPGVRICDECVQLCMSILDDGYQPGRRGRVRDPGPAAHSPGDQGGTGSVRHRSGRRQGGPVRGGLQPL